jgi:hypothetical protein
MLFSLRISVLNTSGSTKAFLQYLLQFSEYKCYVCFQSCHNAGSHIFSHFYLLLQSVKCIWTFLHPCKLCWRVLPSLSCFLLEHWQLDENQFHAVTWYFPSTLCNLGPTAIHNSSFCQPKRKVVRTWFKQPTVIEFLIVEKLLPLTFTMYGDKSFDVRTVRCWVWQFKQE